MNIPLTLVALLATSLSAAADPLLSSWLTTESGKYARLYTTDATKAVGTGVTTWTNQAAPAYAGVVQIAYSTDWVYIKTSGLGFHTMGPWYLNAAHTRAFPNWPRNQLLTWRFPRTSAVPAGKTNTGLGAVGYYVDGVAFFDGRDGFSWNGTAETGNANGSWERDAWINEGVTFDPALAHQEQTGTYHYHANPIALRHLLGDHVTFNTGSKTYSESTEPVTKHSPILGWVRDGYPIYGPYGYHSAMDHNSGVRRMVGGFQLRNGVSGTDNLTGTGRTSLPAWAARAGFAAQTGPVVSTAYPLGRYMQDNAYLGDLGHTRGIDFDLDEYNGRLCVTPGFPNGTYAYFVAINADGSPRFPYVIGRSYRGTPSGGASTIGATETTTFTGGAAMKETAALTSVNTTSGDVSLSWNSVEGGTYRVEATPDLSAWTALTSTLPAVSGAATTGYTENGAATGNNSRRFYRVTRTATAPYDSAGSSGGGTGGAQGISTVMPATGNRGATVTLTITLNSAFTPPPPPNNVAPSAVTLTRAGATTVTATSSTRNAGTGVVTSNFTIPAEATAGAYTGNAAFGPNTWSLANGFTVN